MIHGPGFVTPPGDSLSMEAGGIVPAEGTRVLAPPSGGDLSSSTDANAAPEAAPAELVWSVSGQSAAKPSNDSYERADGKVWRKSEDRFRISDTPDGLLAAVADGAGSSGMYCGPWAEALVERLPDTPISNPDALNQWIDGFWESFSAEYKKQTGDDAGKLTKFVQEGSYSTLVACWLGKRDDGITLNWLGYGDSPLYIFDGEEEAMSLSVCYPSTLGEMERDPHLLNWKNLAEDAHLRAGKRQITGPATVVLASDGIGQLVLFRYLAAIHALGGDGTPPVPSKQAAGLLGEFRQLIQTGKGRLADMARAHANFPGSGFADEMAAFRVSLASEDDFLRVTGDYYGHSLMPNDDATLILIDVAHPDIEEIGTKISP